MLPIKDESCISSTSSLEKEQDKKRSNLSIPSVQNMRPCKLISSLNSVSNLPSKTKYESDEIQLME